MSSKSMSLKAKIKKYAMDNNIPAQVVLQNYMFERFLERLANSKYKDNFVIKGGMLISAIIGLDTRTTMDLDTTVKNLVLTKENIVKVIYEISQIKIEDEVAFEFISINDIRKDDVYGGYQIRFNAIYDNITTYLSIDVSTGDIITPNPVEYEFIGIFDEDTKINVWGYNIETVLAEKVETILSRGIVNTRPRDFYDVYILTKTQIYNKEVFEHALKATASHRKSDRILTKREKIIEVLSESSDLNDNWSKYQRKFNYAKDISFIDTIEGLRTLVL